MPDGTAPKYEIIAKFIGISLNKGSNYYISNNSNSSSLFQKNNNHK